MKNFILIFIFACTTQRVQVSSMVLAASVSSIDYIQTRWMADDNKWDRPDKRVIGSQAQSYHEGNPILGRHPSDMSINMYFILIATGLTVSNICFQRKYSIPLNFLLTFIEISATHNNYMAGVEM